LYSLHIYLIPHFKYSNSKKIVDVFESPIITPEAFADLIVVEGKPLEDLNLLTGQGKYLAAIMKEGQFLKNNFKKL